MSDIETKTRRTITDHRIFTRTLPDLVLDAMPRKSVAVEPQMTVSRRIVNGEPQAVDVRLRVRRLRRDGVVARNAIAVFQIGDAYGAYAMRENFTAETIERIEQAAREVRSEFDAIDWDHVQ